MLSIDPGSSGRREASVLAAEQRPEERFRPLELVFAWTS